MSNNEEQKNDLLLDHNYDGIQEFDNSLPRWWLYGFYFTIAFSIWYMVQYHIIEDGNVQENEYLAEVKEAETLYASAKKPESSGPIALLTSASDIAAGKEIFTNNICYTCHREDGGGLVGPNLTDEFWMHGCSPEDIVKSIKTGFPDKGMLPYGNSVRLDDKQLIQLASYIASLKGTQPENPKPIDPEREVPCEKSLSSAE